MIEAFVEFTLLYPISLSSETAFEMARLWGCRVSQYKAFSSKIIIIIPWKVFKKMFGSLPRKGEWDIPSGTESFFSKCKVLKVKVREDESKSNKNSKAKNKK